MSSSHCRAANAPLAKVLNREALALGPEHAVHRDTNFTAYAKVLHAGVAEAHVGGLGRQPARG